MQHRVDKSTTHKIILGRIFEKDMLFGHHFQGKRTQTNKTSIRKGGLGSNKRGAHRVIRRNEPRSLEEFFQEAHLRIWNQLGWLSYNNPRGNILNTALPAQPWVADLSAYCSRRQPSTWGGAAPLDPPLRASPHPLPANFDFPKKRVSEDFKS